MSAALRQAITSRLAPRSVGVLPAFPPQYTVSRVESLFDRWPQCLHAKQPPELPRELGGGDCVLRPWARDAKTFRLRLPAESSAGLVGPFRGAGDCLLPYLRPGDLSWIDPDIEPADGDFVIVLWSEDFYQRVMAASDEFIATTGRAMSGIACKRLARVNGEWCATTVGSRGSTAAVPLAGNARVLGVVRYIERAGRVSTALDAHCIKLERVTMTDLLGPNAATEIFSASDIGPLTVTLTAPATQIASQQVKFVTVTLIEQATVEVTANYRAGVNTAGTFEMYSFLYRSIGAAIVASTERIYKTGTVYEPFAGIATFVASAGTYRFGIGCTIELGNGVNNVDAIFRDINLRATVVKR